MGYTTKDQGGGILNNSINRIVFINVIFLTCLLTTACAGELSKDRISCVENVLDSKVVRVDNKNQRLFMVNANLTAERFSSKVSDIRACLNSDEWGNDWAISIFTAPKYAGYKDDKNIIPLHKNNEWAKAYKLEYLNSKRTLIVSPALNPVEISL
jgi:hypothetical protein